MEDENDLDNIFEEYENADAQESTNEPQNEEDSTNIESNEAETREVVPVPKRIIRNPRLKFNADRLCGERGIPIVTKHFKNVKFKGKGHEKEDLNKLLSTLEHWSHRLFPSMKFEACLRQIEKLGKKRAVQTCLVKIRRDMPILGSDFVDDDEDNEREEAQNEQDFESPPQDAFDKLFGASMETGQTSNLPSTLHNPSTSGAVLGSSFGGSLTEEQCQRMEYNKVLATERRKAIMAAKQAATDDEDSGRVSPSVLEPGFGENSVSGTTFESSPNLDQQFESLFDQPNRERLVLEDSKKSEYESKCDDSENNLSTYDDSEKNPHESAYDESEKSLHQSIYDDIEKNLHHDFEKSPHESAHDESEKSPHQSTYDDIEKNLHHDFEKSPHESAHDESEKSPHQSTYDDIEKNLHHDFEKSPHESAHDESEKSLHQSTYDDIEKNLHHDFEKSPHESAHDESEKSPHQSTYDDIEKNLHHDFEKSPHESAHDESEKSPHQSTYDDIEKNLHHDFEKSPHESAHDESEKSPHQSTYDDIEKNLHHDFEKSPHESILEGDSEKNQSTSIQKDSKRNQYESIHDSGTCPHETTHDVSKLNKCESLHLTIEKETEQLGLDELMDLVDEEDTAST